MLKKFLQVVVPIKSTFLKIKILREALAKVKIAKKLVD